MEYKVSCAISILNLLNFNCKPLRCTSVLPLCSVHDAFTFLDWWEAKQLHSGMSFCCQALVSDFDTGSWSSGQELKSFQSQIAF